MTDKNNIDSKQLLAENEDLRDRLIEAEETLRAIRSGEVDALMVPGMGGEQLFTLRGADQAYRILIEEMNEGALTMTAEGVILYANRHFAKMLKAPLEKVTGTTINKWIAPDSQTILQALLSKGRNENRREQLTLTADDETRVPVYLSVSNLLINGMPASYGLVATDLTEQERGDAIVTSEKLTQELLAAANQSRRALLSVIEDQKQAEEELRQSEADLRTLVEHSPIAMIVDVGVDMDEKITLMNLEFTNLFGYTREDVPDVRHWWPLAYPDQKYRKELMAEWIEKAENAIKSHSTIKPMDVTATCKDGSIRYVRISLASTGGRKIITFEDLTERRQAEEEILKLNEELEAKVQQRTQQLMAVQEELVRTEKLAVLGQIAGSVGHELRNPLGVMSNAVYFLQTVLSDADETTREYLNIINNEIAASERIVSDLLDAVRTKPPNPNIVGVAELINKVLCKLTIPPSVSVKLDFPETLPLIRVDAMQIHQVFGNLISNSVEAMPNGGILQIRAFENRQDGTVSVSVRDSGIGMTQEQLGHMFQPLFTTKARGIGLGLVVVKNLTEANGGTVTVESEAGKGALVTVTLPAANETGVSI